VSTDHLNQHKARIKLIINTYIFMCNLAYPSMLFKNSISAALNLPHPKSEDCSGRADNETNVKLIN
jgi:hypothetical protein